MGRIIVSKGCFERNPHLRDVLASNEMPPPPVAGSSTEGRRVASDEKRLQQQCEQYLTLMGYRRLTADEAVAAHESYRIAADRPRGWFGHIYEARRNSFMPDVFVFAEERPPLLVELKRRKRYQKGQREMIEMGYWKQVNTLDEFVEVLRVWEGG